MRCAHQNSKSALAIATTIGALAVPAAFAHAAQSGWVVRPNPDQQATELAWQAAARSPQTSTWVVRPNPDEQTPMPAPTTIVRVNNPSSGFNWDDAGIGAAGALGLAMLTAGGALAITQRRTHRTTRSPRAIS
jgi:hypothetical protein